MDKKEAIRIMIKAAKEYNTHMKDSQFLIIYKEKEVLKHLEVVFYDYHFLHLTGVLTELKAKRFFKACINHKLSEQDFKLSDRGLTQQKLDVLPHLSSLLYNNCMLGPFIGDGVRIKADYFVGDTRWVLSLGLGKRGKEICPISLYHEDVRNKVSPKNRVLAVFKRSRNSKEKYSEVTFQAKGIDLAQMNLSSELRNMIQMA